jgi:hypothetical protein
MCRTVVLRSGVWGHPQPHPPTVGREPRVIALDMGEWGSDRYQADRRWKVTGTSEHVQAALIVAGTRQWGARLLSDDKGHIDMHMGSKFWYFGLGWFTRDSVVPMRLRIDVRTHPDSVTEIDAVAASDLLSWILSRPGDKQRYASAFVRLFDNLKDATE